MRYPREYSRPRDRTCILVLPALADGFFSQLVPPGKPPYSCSVWFSRSVMSKALQPQELQHARLPCPLPTPRACSNSCPLSWWCHPTISSSVVPFSSHLQSCPTSGSFQMSQFFTSGGQVLEFQLQHQSFNEYLGLISFTTDWYGSLPSNGLSRVFFNTTVQKHQFFSTQLSLWSNSHIHTWLLEKPQLD